MQNPFVWYDLMTADVPRAEKFYASVLGWTFTAQAPAYRVANVSGVGVGGITAMPEHLEGTPPFWSGYIYTPNVDEACARCVERGGQVCRPAWDIPGIIRMAVLADPSGAMFNIMQPLMAGAEARAQQGAQGTIGWHELHGSDAQKDFDFYHAMFGWTKGVTMPMGEMGDYLLFQIDGQDTGGMMRKFPSMPQSFWAYYFNVEGIDAGIARLKAAGGSVLIGPHQVPGGNWVVNATDDQGAYFSLLSATK